jgi:hypothetical protein
MTAGGYITDRRCPATPEHGVVLGMRDGGHYCPHSDHPSAKPPTKAFWSDDEFEHAKSATTPIAIAAAPHKKALPKKRPMKRRAR